MKWLSFGIIWISISAGVAAYYKYHVRTPTPPQSPAQPTREWVAVLGPDGKPLTFAFEVARDDGKPSNFSAGALNELTGYLNSNPAHRVMLLGYFQAPQHKEFAERIARNVQEELLKRGFADWRVPSGAADDPEGKREQFKVIGGVEKPKQ